jgi:cell division protein FtsI/penicillin-binding protein 2
MEITHRSPLRPLRTLRCVLCVNFFACSCLPAHPQQTLYSQSLQTALARQNPNPAHPIPPGSLVKPFLSLAYAAAHPTFPTITCHGHSDLCWSAAGHGPLTLPDAIAQSCNAYFLALARTLTSSPIPYLPAPPPNPTPETLIGLTPAWLISPNDLIHAYASLLASPSSPTRTAILLGMRASASHGTANRIGHHPGVVLAKTGTAPCIDLPCKATGDGLIIAAVPAANPTLLLLVRRRATTGAMTAPAASRILSQLKALHAY